MKFYGLFLSLVLSMTSCQQDSPDINTRDAIFEYSSLLEKKESIECTSYGFRWAGPDKIYDGKIHTIVLGYKVDKRLQLPEARKLFYEVVDGLLKCLNGNEKLRGYFFHYPLTYRDLEFHFSLDYHRIGSLRHGDVNSIHINENRVRYFIVDAPTNAPDREYSNEEFTEMFKDHLAKHRTITKKLPEKD